MALGIACWDHENSPGRPEAHFRALALPAPRKAPGSVRAAADCTSPGGRPGAATVPSAPQPTSPPSPLENISLHFSYYLFPYVSMTPHARRGRRIRDGLRPLPPTPIKNKLATQLSLTLRDPAALLVRSSGKPYPTTFLTVAGIPRRFSSVPPENLVTQLSSPSLHPAGLLARSDLSTPGPRRRAF